MVNSNYINKKRIISKVKTITNDDTLCVFMESDLINTYPVCKKCNEYIAYSATNIIDDNFYKIYTIQNNEDKYANIDIYSLNGKRMAVWNHLGFYFLSHDIKKSFNMLTQESYRDNYSFKVEEYIILPNYDEEYHFNRVYLLNLKNGKTDIWNLNNYINYDFYVLGVKNMSVYLVDRKEKTEYKLGLKKHKIEVISKNGMGTIYNDKWEEISMVKLANNDYSFKSDKIIDYKIVNNKLYMSYLNGINDILVSDKKIDRIIYEDQQNIYYISKNELYYFSVYSGEVLSLRYNELEFNNGVSIYIY